MGKSQPLLSAFDDHEEIYTIFADYIKKDEIKYIVEGGSRDCGGGLALAQIFTNAQVYCFEPNPLQECICQINADKHPNVHFVPKGLTDKNSTLDFYSVDVAKGGNVGVSSLFPFDDKYLHKHPWRHHSPIPVECVNLRDWCQENDIPHIDILDLDIQGAEIPCLIGMGDYLDTLKAIRVEVNLEPYYSGCDSSYEAINEVWIEIFII